MKNDLKVQESATGASSTLRSNLIVAAVATVLSLIAGEVVVRVTGAILDRRPVVQGHPRLGWTGWPNLDRAAKRYHGGSFRLSTDSLGRRLTYPSGTHFSDTTPTVLIAGDSFMQGVGVDDEQSVAWRLARALPGRRIVNLGVAGYGTDQELLSLEEYRLSNTVRVSDIVVVLYENDFRDVQSSFDYALARSKPRFELSGGKLRRLGYKASLLDRLMDYSRLVWLARTKVWFALRPPERPLQDGVSLAVACLDEIRENALRQNVRVHLFAHRQIGPPYGFSPSEVSDSAWNDFIQRSGAIDLTPAILAGPGANPIGFDKLHWSNEGSRRAAARMLDVMRGTGG